ncbi:MAG: ABC transporter substrate-binding protein [Spirochaetaceae bacterium]|nr:ABC transporter substrate-binding protein [Spirochaetaceae bacterium]
MKKSLFIFISVFLLSSFFSCTKDDGYANAGKGAFTLYYPEFMKDKEGETLVLDSKPERIVCLSNTALQVLVRANVKPVAITNLVSGSAEWPEYIYELPQITVGMSGLDMESIVALEPDLVLVGHYQKETYGKQFVDAGIPVYYTQEGPSVTYNETKLGSIALAKSFGDERLKTEIETEFSNVEKRASDFTKSHTKEKMMIFFHKPGSYLQTSQGYLGSMLSMLPYENLTDSIIDPSMRTTPSDIETCITQNPTIIFGISPGIASGEQVRAIFEEVFNSDRDVWNQIDAVKNNNIVYLGTEYISSKGLQIIDSVHALIDMLEGREEMSNGITIHYPENMQKLGYTESVKLDKIPERVVCMNSSPVLALNKLGVKMIAIPKSSVLRWPDSLKDAVLLNTVMNSNFDIETVVALEPDLVILGYTSAETYGKQLQDIGIPVYFVDAGHTVSYESIKMQTECLINAFGKGSIDGKEMLTSFEQLEKSLATSKEKLNGKTVMVLQSSPPSHYIQTSGGTLGTMADMIGLTNVYSNDKASMVQIDYEQALDLHPDIVLAVGMSPTGEGHKTIMEEDFDKNREYWNAIEAIRDGNILYLPIYFISSAGINVVDHISELNTLVLNHFGK